MVSFGAFQSYGVVQYGCDAGIMVRMLQADRLWSGIQCGSHFRSRRPTIQVRITATRYAFCSVLYLIMAKLKCLFSRFIGTTEHKSVFFGFESFVEHQILICRFYPRTTKAYATKPPRIRNRGKEAGIRLCSTRLRSKSIHYRTSCAVIATMRRSFAITGKSCLIEGLGWLWTVPFSDIAAKTPLKLTYTAFHGVGYYYTPKLLVDVFGFRQDNIVYVEEQVWSDTLCLTGFGRKFSCISEAARSEFSNREVPEPGRRSSSFGKSFSVVSDRFPSWLAFRHCLSKQPTLLVVR